MIQAHEYDNSNHTFFTYCCIVYLTYCQKIDVFLYGSISPAKRDTEKGHCEEVEIRTFPIFIDIIIHNNLLG